VEEQRRLLEAARAMEPRDAFRVMLTGRLVHELCEGVMGEYMAAREEMMARHAGHGDPFKALSAGEMSRNQANAAAERGQVERMNALLPLLDFLDILTQESAIGTWVLVRCSVFGGPELRRTDTAVAAALTALNAGKYRPDSLKEQTWATRNRVWTERLRRLAPNATADAPPVAEAYARAKAALLTNPDTHWTTRLVLEMQERTAKLNAKTADVQRIRTAPANTLTPRELAYRHASGIGGIFGMHRHARGHSKEGFIQLAVLALPLLAAVAAPEGDAQAAAVVVAMLALIGVSLLNHHEASTYYKLTDAEFEDRYIKNRRGWF
jgi:hypothetical protein